MPFPIGSAPLRTPNVVTIAGLTTLLQERLDDVPPMYWTETRLYIVEALRVFNSFCNYWKTTVPVTLTSGELFYDLTDPNIFSPPPLTYVVTDTQLVSEIEYALLEPPITDTWTGSTQFTLADIVQAIYARRDQFLLDTGCVITRYQQAIDAPNVERTPLNHSVIDIRRAAFLDLNGAFHQLWREDENNMAYFTPDAPQNPGMPNSYSIAAEPPYLMRLSPPPSNPGTIDMLTVAEGTPELATGVPQNVPIGIPDDYCWGIKYGALADLFNKKEEASDEARAEYCEQRYMECVSAAKLITNVISARLNNRQIKLDSLMNLDTFAPNWHNTLGTPNAVVIAGWNMLVPDRMPDRPYGVVLDMVQPAPVSNDSAPLTLSGAMVDAILDYAQHAATLKMGGEEFNETIAQSDNLRRIAMLNNQRMNVAGVFTPDLMRVAQKEDKHRKRVA